MIRQIIIGEQSHTCKEISMAGQYFHMFEDKMCQFTCIKLTLNPLFCLEGILWNSPKLSCPPKKKKLVLKTSNRHNIEKGEVSNKIIRQINIQEAESYMVRNEYCTMREQFSYITR